MNRLLVVAFILSIAGCVSAPSPTPIAEPKPVIATHAATDLTTRERVSVVTNPTLQTDAATAPVPTGWRVDGTAAEFVLDSAKTYVNRPSIRVRYVEGAPYAGIIQTLNVQPLRGKTVTVSVQVARDTKDVSVGGWIGAFDMERKRIAYANSYDTKVDENGAWTNHRFSLAIPANAERVLIGAAAWGKTGTIWIGEVDASVAEGTANAIANTLK